MATSNSRPIALVIEDNVDDRYFAEKFLSEAGFQVRSASSLRDGAIAAYKILSESEYSSTLILTDLMLPTGVDNELDSCVLMADLTIAMHNQELRPAHIIVITNTTDLTLHETARLSGAQLILMKPFKEVYLETINNIITTPPQLPKLEPTLKALGHMSKRLLKYVFATEPFLSWDKDQVELLLDRPEGLERPYRVWLSRIGGEKVVYPVLRKRINENEQRVFDSMVSGRHLSRPGQIEDTAFSKATYYRYRDTMLSKLKVFLNEYTPEDWNYTY